MPLRRLRFVVSRRYLLWLLCRLRDHRSGIVKADISGNMRVSIIITVANVTEVVEYLLDVRLFDEFVIFGEGIHVDLL